MKKLEEAELTITGIYHFKIKDMRIKINGKIYRLKEIESGVDSLMELVEKPKYKDGDFVVNEAGGILIFKEKVGDFIYDHAYLASNLMLFTSPDAPTFHGINCYATEEEKQKMLDALAKKGKRWNAEKKCVEDISVRKFQNGDKVRIKDGVSSKTHKRQSPRFAPEMDDLIGKTMTVDRYTDVNGYVVCNGSSWCFHEDWLEPWSDEPKVGDWVISWNNDMSSAVIGVKINATPMPGCKHVLNNNNSYKHAIKFESKEQFEKILNGKV